MIIRQNSVYLTIPMENKEKRIFLQNGFFPSMIGATPFHKHAYAEIHVVAKGALDIIVDNQPHVLKEGSVFIIPAKKYHCLPKNNNGVLHNAFQLECDCNEIIHRHISPEILLDFFREIEALENDDNYSKVFSYISLIISNLLDSYCVRGHETTDDGYLIHEFFSVYYNKNIQVSDLAEALHLSEKQTQLLVKRHTGKTFKQELAAYRMKIADFLIANTDLSLTEIAFDVGFQTYSGFWKMYKAHQEELDNQQKKS